MRTLLAVALVVLFPMVLHAQYGADKSNTIPAAAGGDWNATPVQTKTCAVANGTNTCTIATGTTTTAGNLFGWVLSASNNGAGSTGNSVTRISSIACTSGSIGTPLTMTTLSSNTGTHSGTNVQRSVYYVKPANSAACTFPMIITLNQNSAGTTSPVVFIEEACTTNCSAVDLALDNTNMNYQASTTNTAANVTLTGNNFVIQVLGAGVSSGHPSAVASPYNSCGTGCPYLSSSGNSFGVSVAADPAGTGPAWTTASAREGMSQTAFSFSPATPIPASYIGFDGAGAVANATPTVQSLTQDFQGNQGCEITITSTDITYATAASMPLLNSAGPFSDGTSVASGAGSLGLLISSHSSTSEVNSIQCTVEKGSSLTGTTVSYKYNDTLAGAPTFDPMTIVASNDSADQNGSCSAGFFNLETPQGNGSHINVTCSTQCPCTVTLTAVWGDGTNAGTATMHAYDKTGAELAGSPASHAMATTLSYTQAVAIGDRITRNLGASGAYMLDSFQICWLNTACTLNP